MLFWLVVIPHPFYRMMNYNNSNNNNNNNNNNNVFYSVTLSNSCFIMYINHCLGLLLPMCTIRVVLNLVDCYDESLAWFIMAQ